MSKDTPALSRAVLWFRAARERERLLVEWLGAALIVGALLLVSIPLGIGVAGVLLVVLANFGMGAEDAADSHDGSPDSTLRR